MSRSFSKLSYVIREDSKKIFNSSIEKSTEIQEESEKHNKEMIKKALNEILSDKETIISDIVISARKEADQLLLDAKKDASQIIMESKEESNNIKKQNIEQTAHIIESVLSDYVASEFKVEDHENFINTALDNYLKNDWYQRRNLRENKWYLLWE